MRVFLPARSADVSTGDFDCRARVEVLQYEFTSFEGVRLDKLILRTTATSSRKEQTTLLKKTRHLVLAPQTSCSETAFKDFLLGRKV